MSGLHNLKPERVVHAFIKAGWERRKASSGHAILTKEGNANILSIPMHKGKPIKQGLILRQIKNAGMTVEEFMKFYK